MVVRHQCRAAEGGDEAEPCNVEAHQRIQRLLAEAIAVLSRQHRTAAVLVQQSEREAAPRDGRRRGTDSESQSREQPPRVVTRKAPPCGEDGVLRQVPRCVVVVHTRCVVRVLPHHGGGLAPSGTTHHTAEDECFRFLGADFFSTAVKNLQI